MTPPDQSEASEPWTFQTPKRRPGIRLFNSIGIQLSGLGLRRPLIAEEILQQAQQRTRLSDWGGNHFLEPLNILVDALEDEAHLTPFGRTIIRGLIRSGVENRLRVQRYAVEHPAALEAPLLPALLVVGMPRTGTTLLHNLLSLDPAARPLLGWESLLPAPRPGKRRDDRRRQAGLVAAGLDMAAHELSQIHPFSAKAPEECTWLMTNTFQSWAFSLFASVPSYEEWLWGLDDGAWAPAYRDYLCQLLVLQHQRAGAHWVLKSPVHLMAVAPLLKAIESIRVILTDRDPRASVPSTCSLFAAMRALASDHIDRRALGQDVVERLAEGMRRAEAAQQAESERIVRVQFDDLVSNPLGEIRRIYSHFGLILTADAEAAMRRWLRDKPHVPKHRYSLAQFGLDEVTIEERFG